MKHRKEPDMPETQRPPIRRPAGKIKPKAKRYSPPGCGSCAAIRPEGENYTDVRKTEHVLGYIVRYLRCRFCGHTWQVSKPKVESE